MKAAVEKTINKWEKLDIVFANAGINGVWAPIDELKPEEWEKTISINLNGCFNTIHFAVPELKKNGGAVIINSSINGNRVFSNTGATAYASTKAALVAMAKMLAVELAEFKIRVNVVCPGWVKTEIEERTERKDVENKDEPIPLTNDKPGTPEDIAKLIGFLASDDANFISGTEIFADGTQSLVE